MKPRTKKLLLIAAGAMFLLLCVVVAGDAIWHRVLAAGRAEVLPHLQEGRALGATITASACVDSALVREQADGPDARMMVRLDERAFLDGCLRTGRARAALCDSVPKNLLRGVAWAGAECRQRGIYDSHCPELLQPVIDACSSRDASGG